ncbi:MAG: glycosyltransferase family 2 protein [Bacteroidetes bacterium]|nr:glycosyltransferase family 2 protein [Bacteroidota bacterium]
MKVCGFTFIKDAIKYDYPISEAILSILPICDEFIVAVGKSSDETLALIQSIAPEKIKIIETIWDETQREGGRVLAVETDKAFAAISEDVDWAFYIQGDEVVHEKYLPVIKEAMLKYRDDDRVDGLLFHYLHFYGSYDYIATASNFYKKEIRVVKRKQAVYSYRDAQGFRKGQDEKLRVKQIEAFIYHYGWVKQPKAMQAKQENFHKYWHDDQWVEKHVAKADEFDYSTISSLARFEGTHPQVMQQRIDKINWRFDYDMSYNKFSLKDQFKKMMYLLFKVDLNYKIVFSLQHLAHG